MNTSRFSRDGQGKPCLESQQTGFDPHQHPPERLDASRALASSALRNLQSEIFNLKSERGLAARLRHYLATLSSGRLLLWCYFIWYLVVLVRYFDPNPRLWLTSTGLSLIIGVALYVSTAAAGTKKLQLERWQTIRLFLMPFCVSSFAALVKGRGFILIFSPNPREILLAVGLCAALGATVLIVKKGLAR
jgi:hypothetical protein